MGVCCVDFDNVIKMPNIKEKGFLKTLFSDEVIKKRKMGLNKKFGIYVIASQFNAPKNHYFN